MRAAGSDSQFVGGSILEADPQFTGLNLHAGSHFDYLAVQTQVGGSGHLLRANFCLRRSAFRIPSGAAAFR